MKDRSDLDKSICELLNAGDSKGMELLYNSYYHILVIWANTFFNDMQKAEDLVQELYIAIWEEKIYKKFRPDSIAAFLKLLVKNRSLNVLRVKHTLYEYIKPEEVESAWEEYNENHEKILAIIDGEINQLPPRTQDIIRYVFIEGLKYREVAEKMGITVSTVSSLLMRAVLKMRDRLTDSAVLLLYFYLSSHQLND